MGTFSFGMTAENVMTPLILPYDCAASQLIQAGDPVVLTNVGGVVRVRKLTAADIAAHFQNGGSVVCGILGLANHAIYTDANGFASGQGTPSTVSPGAAPIYPLPNYASGIDVDPTNGVSRLNVLIANAETYYQGAVAGAADAAVTVDSTFVGKPAGIQIFSTTQFALNSASTGTDICAVITQPNEQSKTFNTSSTLSTVFWQMLGTFQQYRLGTYYGT